MYQHRFGFQANSGPERYAAANFGLPQTIPTLAEKLKAAGYSTGMVGKWHIGFKPGLRPHERGFDFFYGFLGGARSYYPERRYGSPSPILRNGEVVEGETEYLTDAFAREAVDFVGRNRDEQPWFLYLAFNAVHDPMEATEKYEARFPEIHDPRRRTLAAMLSAMDDAIGLVMTAIRERGEEEETLIFFYSDNGGIPSKNASLNHPLRGFKGQVYEGGIRVPFLMQWKGTIPRGQVYRNPVMGFDVHATALSAAGSRLDSQPAIDGVNLLPFLTGESNGRPHEQLFWRDSRQRAARVGDWKLVVPPRGEASLFHLASDIGEQKDLATTHPDKLKELQRIYAAWDAEMMEPQWIRQDRYNAEPGGKLKDNPTGRRAARGSLRIEEAFQNADKNRDGKLTREEYPRPEAFPNVDADGDGFATLEEVRAYFGGRRSRRAPRR
jgi:arylsulfatase A-like enzyme